MIYIDPPYGFIKDDNNQILNKQISEAGYNAFWNKDDDLGLYEYVKNIDKYGGSFVISGLYKHNDKTSWILDKLINDGFFKKNIEFNYNKVSRNKQDKKSEEIIIKNF